MNKSLNSHMNTLPLDWKYRWCESDVCACLGAANCSGGLIKNGFTKEQWQEWVNKNPQTELNSIETNWSKK